MRARTVALALLFGAGVALGGALDYSDREPVG